MRRFDVLVCAAVAAFAYDTALAQAPLLPGADGTVCDFLAANTGHQTSITLPPSIKPPPFGYQEMDFSDSLLKRTLADVDGDGDMELLDVIYTPWGEGPVVIGAREGFPELPPDGPDGFDYYHDDTWFALGEYGGARWLNFGGVWYAAYFDHSRQIVKGAVRVDKDGPRFACRMNGGFVETVRVMTSIPAIAAFCRSWTSGNGGPGAPDKPLAALTVNDRRYITTKLPGHAFHEINGGIHGEGPDTIGPQSVSVFDIDGDGKPERFVQIERYGTTRCNATFLDLLPQPGEAEPDPAMRNTVRGLQGEGPRSDGVAGFPTACGWNHQFVEIDSRGYLDSYKFDGPPAHTLSIVQDGRAVELCSSEYSSRHTVAFDLAHGGELQAGKARQ
ncbi:MAG TPA: hypothetical protein VGO52_11540 [Hyphomonadaceae bacterium]|jgi:hypothetical protein|nr:hypothetical protein [Hyphomonadaceae bacterium]